MYNFKDVYEYSKNFNVLYVEDDKFLLEETTELLEDFFKSITTAVDGQEGLEKYKSYKKQTNQYFDLIITDINMPRLDGGVMIEKIRAINEAQSIIVLSAYNESSRLLDLIHLGISNFVMKPIEAEQIFNILYKTCRNISNLKKEEEFLLSQSKLASMGEMLDSIAHQWLQPINTIQMQSNLLKIKNIQHNVNEEMIDKYIENQSAQIRHLTDTLQEFRGFFRPNFNLEISSLKQQVDSVLLLLQDSLLKCNIEIDVEVSDKQNIKIIVNEFKHVLINILNNSCDAFNEKNISQTDRKISFNSFENGDEVVLTISDNAGGMDKNIIDKIFNSNFTTKNDGTGMGLYISKQIMKKINGKLKVENINNGIKFSIILKKQN